MILGTLLRLYRKALQGRVNSRPWDKRLSLKLDLIEALLNEKSS
jgi:hypothetical protein